MSYLLKVNDIEFPIKYMQMRTYAVNDTPIVKSDYYDGEYGRHIELAPKTDISIEFSLRALRESDYVVAIGFFSYEEFTLEYKVSKDGTYQSGVFMLDPEISKNGVYTELLNFGTSIEELWIEEKEIRLIRKRGIT